MKLIKLTNQKPLITSLFKNEDESEIINKIENANNTLDSKEKKQNDLLVKINDVKQKDTNKDLMFNYNTDIIKVK